MTDVLANIEWAPPEDRQRTRRVIYANQRLRLLSAQLGDRNLNIALDETDAQGAPDDGMPLCTFEEFGRATKMYGATIDLATQGNGQGAQAFSAIVIQSSFLCLWSIIQPLSVNKRARLHSVYCRQWDLDLGRKSGVTKSLPSDEILSGAERSEVEQLFGPTPDGLWSGHSSVSELIDEVADGLQPEYARNRLGALTRIHAWALGMAAGTGLANQSFRLVRTLPDGRTAIVVNFGEGPEFVLESLLAASSAYIVAMGAVVRRCAPDLEPELKECDGLLWLAYKDPEVLANLQDDDNCPCDEPDTKWGTCHKWTIGIGSTVHQLLTDEDVPHFVPYSPASREKKDALNLPGSPPDLPRGPFIATFTFRLPFPLGIVGGSRRTFDLQDSWSDVNDVAHFGRVPRVHIRIHNEPTDGLEMWPRRAERVLNELYAGETGPSGALSNLEPMPEAYEQWISLETPNAWMSSEEKGDPAFAFHRCLSIFNLFLTALDLSIGDARVGEVATQELGMAVFRGAYVDGKWRELGTLFMHPDAYPAFSNPISMEELDRQVNQFVTDLQVGRPFMTSVLWHSRAVRALRYRGDTSVCVVSAQTAAESMVFDLLRSLMVDEGATSAEIEASEIFELSYKSMIRSELPRRLGGSWSLDSGPDRPVKNYWNSLYLVRNRVVHRGYTPSPKEAQEALDGFERFREFVSVRLRKTCRRYPRTLVAKVGENGLVRRGWDSAFVRDQIQKFRAEGLPFYLPKDLAGRGG